MSSVTVPSSKPLVYVAKVNQLRQQTVAVTRLPVTTDAAADGVLVRQGKLHPVVLRLLIGLGIGNFMATGGRKSLLPQSTQEKNF